jgi:EAL domain-containing protein (putative c-di-GMP-specific phosphodiesterase class I)
MRMPEVSHPSPTTAEDFRHVLGYEALARGPMGSALESPAALFGAAWRAGRVAELDWACRAAAFTGAAEAGLGPPFTLFVNAEPVSLEAGWGVALDDVGAAPASLAVLPFVRPDAVKLDMRLLQGRTTPRPPTSSTPSGPTPERTDAVVIAEGIETTGAGRDRAQRPAGLLPGGRPLHPGHPQPV